ncbi:MAG: hypothetical protein CVU39_06415 [Chloroflexi bacterium HGW-Chloroflexi-10]|nr:MAG: hypothetical protein CVU39_06415 [Chloroflexi bacterium HGW-Chloroflexi-10]
MQFLRQILLELLVLFKKNKYLVFLKDLLVIIILIILYQRFVLGYTEWVAWTGFGETSPDGNKTFWDWLDLLIIPFVLSIGALIFNKIQKENEQNFAKQRYADEQSLIQTRFVKEQELIGQRQENEMLLNLDIQRGTSFQAFIDRMSDLVLKNDLQDTSCKGEIKSIARSLTITNMFTLDEVRNNLLLKFLRELKLLDIQNPIIVFDKYDLRKMALKSVDFTGISLKNVNLEEADLADCIFDQTCLRGADLTRAKLYGAKFLKADLQNAQIHQTNLATTTIKNCNFSNAGLIMATLVGYITETNFAKAKMRDMNIELTTFEECDFSEVDFTSSDFMGVNFTNCDVSNAKFRHAKFRGGSFHESNLSNTDFSGLDLSGVSFLNSDLSNARFENYLDFRTIVTYKQLAQAKHLEGATLPDGTIFHGNPQDLLEMYPSQTTATPEPDQSP